MPEFSDLSVSAEQVRFLIAKSRQLNAKDVVTEPNPGSNAIDDGMASVLEDHGSDPAEFEITDLFGAMNADEMLDLATLTILGRDDGTLDEWSELRSVTAQAIGNRITKALMEMPLLSDYLAEGLSKFGVPYDQAGSET